MNERWKRNLPNIISLEKKKEELQDVLNENEEVEELKLQIIDIENEINGLKRSFQQLLFETKEDIKKMYLNEEDDKDWSVAWSGGKDSTTVTGLVIDVLNELLPEQRKRKIHFVMSDTAVENPVLESYMHDQVNKLRKYINENKLPCTVHLVQRELNESYFYLILGRGYFLPQNNGRGRWCTQRLKTKPQYKALEDIRPSYQLTGVRLSESAMRKASIQKWTVDARLNKKIGKSEKSNTFMVIVDWTIEDVWEYLQRERLAWTSTHAVRTLYKEATGECGFTNPKGVETKASLLESCGARFGCWVCPVVLKDRSTESLSNFHDWMKPLTEYRMLQIKIAGDYKPIKPDNQKRSARSFVLKEAEKIGKEIKKITKSGHKRDGRKYVDNNGEIRNDMGTLTIEARKFLFNELMNTQNKVNELRRKSGLDPIELISEEEIELIKKQWEDDENNAPWLITNVNGIRINELNKLLHKLDELERNQPLEI